MIYDTGISSVSYSLVPCPAGKLPMQNSIGGEKFGGAKSLPLDIVVVVVEPKLDTINLCKLR